MKESEIEKETKTAVNRKTTLPMETMRLWYLIYKMVAHNMAPTRKLGNLICLRQLITSTKALNLK